MPAKTISGTAIHYEESGSGPPLVLLHGFPLDARVWARQREDLADMFRVITPDLRGFGRSASTSPFTSLKQLADDVRALLVELGALPAVLGGLSMGGYVALEYAKKYPADLRGLILVDTKAEGDTAEGKQGRDKMVQLVREKGSAAVAEQMMPKMLAPSAAQRIPAVARELRAIMEACPPLTIEQALLAMRDRDDHARDLPSITVPTLVIVGQHDAITPPAGAEKMRQAIPHARITIVPDAGHMAPIEQPEQVSLAIGRFIATL
ncbi:MAG TPA: alpha/beta hydrolase [Tepidisphaeraceae bacterium]|nr:alpha/beta hydrolase [Tepidisphaeraceae bacterium]